MKFNKIIINMIFSLILGSASAHPGSTDLKGNYYCRINCEQREHEYSRYSYHKGWTLSTPTISPSPLQSLFPTFQAVKPICNWTYDKCDIIELSIPEVSKLFLSVRNGYFATTGVYFIPKEE